MKSVILKKKKKKTITIPKKYLKKLRWQEGAKIDVEQTEEGLILRKMLPDIKKVYIEITTRCNLSCTFCVRNVWKEPLKDMELKTFRKIISSLRELPELEMVSLGGYGEPLYHKNFFEMVKKLKRLGVRVEAITNGVLIDREKAQELVKSGLDNLTFSIDSVRPEKYKGIRGIDLHFVLDNIKVLNSIRRKRESPTPRLGIEFVAMRSNLEDLLEFGEAIKSLGISTVLISNLLPYNEELKDQILYGDLPDSSGLDHIIYFLPHRLPAKVTLAKMKVKTERKCNFIANKATAISWDGLVSPCYPLMHSHPCYILGRRKEIFKFIFGDVNKKKLLDIWNSKEYLDFRRKVEVFDFPSCTDCDLAQGCYWSETNEEDCWLNTPSCADCLWARGIILCP